MRLALRNARTLPVAVTGLLALALLATPAAGQEPERRDYDIPAQPLTSALSAFATASGVDIIYQQSLATGRRSYPVTGRQPAPTALARLLRGTGLTARFSGPRSAVISLIETTPAPETDAPSRSGSGSATALHMEMAEVRATRVIGGGDRLERQRYAQAVQAAMRDLLRTAHALDGRDTRLELSVSLDREGRVTRIVIVRASRDPAWDQQVVGILTDRILVGPPPATVTTPLSFGIESARPGLPEPRRSQ